MAPRKLEAVSLESNEDPADFESKNVHEIYDAIATHFSSTRYKVHPPPGNKCIAPLPNSRPYPLDMYFIN